MTIIEDVIPADSIEIIRQQTHKQLNKLGSSSDRSDGRIGISNAVAWSQEICSAVTHKTALAAMRAFLGTQNIHFCHQPVMTILRPSDNLVETYPENGWHCDYPYHSDVFPADRWDDDKVYGVQFNICVDEFRSDNAGTQFVPGSHKYQSFVPESMNIGGTRMGVAPHEEVSQMTAPAGSALIYDARTWHRACVELNTSGQNRLAILNAVSPSWVRPMVDKEPGKVAFSESGIADRLSETQRRELALLCHSGTTLPPEGSPALRAKVRSTQRYKL